MNPWKDLVLVTVDILNDTHVGRGPLPLRVLNLSRLYDSTKEELQRAQSTIRSLELQSASLVAQIQELTKQRESVPPPPDYNARILEQERQRNAGQMR